MYSSFIGRKLTHDINNELGVMLIQAGTILKQQHIETLGKHHIDPGHVKVKEPDDIDVYLDLIDKSTLEVKEIFQEIETSGKIPVDELIINVVPTVQHMADCHSFFSLFAALKAKDNYTYLHNIGVGMIAALIGKAMGLHGDELSILTLSAVLHDIGKLKIPEHILHKPGRLTPEEYVEMKKHTLYGYQMLKNCPDVGHRVALVALLHHEREDGKGYPFGVKGSQLDLYSKIVSVADVFHAMSSFRPYQKPRPFHLIMSQIYEGKFGELDPRVVSVFENNITYKMIGSKVILSDGREGKVIYINPHDRYHPLVQMDDHYVDLSKDRQLSISDIIA